MLQDQDFKDMLSDAKFFESYSRYIDELDRYETWEESVDRVMDMHRQFYVDKMTDELSTEIDFATKKYKEKAFLGAQRALQFGGDQLLRHQMKLYNCTSSYCDRPEFFGEYFYILLCGAGAGFSVQTHHIEKLPQVIQRTKLPKVYEVEDSIEGWANALDVLLSSFFDENGKYPEYRGHRVYFDLSKIRPKGAKISGGFKAPGPDGLRLSLDRIEYLLQGLILNKKKNKLKPIHAYDICMHVADAVLSGGVRRSATICLFSLDDEEMLGAKTGNWFSENPQRARSNNSAVVVRDQVTKEQFSNIINNIKQFGEPGFYFVNSTEHTTNPCVEVGMFPNFDGVSGWQGCNLTEINGGVCSTEEKFYEACHAASIVGTLQAGYTDFKFVNTITKKIFEREALLGVSITGWMSNPKILFNEKIMQTGAKIVLETNKKIAKMIGINPSARTTVVKPSGNASVLLKTPSGIHADHAPKYIRNVQMNKESEISQLIKKTNPHMVEESVWSRSNTDYVISFPIIAKKGSYFKDDFKGIKHLDIIKKVQQNWIEFGTDVDLCVDKTVRHNVSNTIIADDWDAIEEYLFENRHYFSGVSFIPETGDRIYNQAPNTKINSLDEIVKTYGTGALFASGLIVDGLNVFENLWAAFDLYKNNDTQTLEPLQQDWLRRLKSFSENYFEDNMEKTELCLKDIYLLHKWYKIQQNKQSIDWVKDLHEKKFTDIDTLAAAACSGVTENGESTCFV